MVDSFIAQSYGRSRNYTEIPNHLFKEFDVKKEGFGSKNASKRQISKNLEFQLYI